MDASTVHQYRFLLLFLAAGFAAGVVAVALLRRAVAGRAAGTEPVEDATRVSPWRDTLALLVAIATLVTLLYLLPAGIVFRFFQTWQAVVFMVVFVAVAGAAAVYAARILVL